MLSGGEPTSTTRYDKPLSKGETRLNVVSQYRAFTRLVHGDDYISFAELGLRSPEAAEHGDVDVYAWQVALSLRWAASDRSELFATLPYRSVRMRVDEDDEHHRDETFSGLGDLRVGLRRIFLDDERLRVAASAGLSLPSGRRNRLTSAAFIDHDEAGDLGIEVATHSHTRLGTGTVDPFVGFDVLLRRESGPMLFGSAELKVPLYDAGDGYRTATSASVTAGMAQKLAGGERTATLFAKFSYAGRDEFHGAPVVGTSGTFAGSLDVPNTGRIEVSVQPTLTWRLSDKTSVETQLNVPVYTRIDEDAGQGDVQLTERAGLVVRFNYAL